MKKWIIPAAVLIVCLLYVAIRYSAAPNENKQTVPPPAEASVPMPEAPPAGATSDDSTSPESTVEAEAATKAFEHFARCLKEADYDEAWTLTSKYFQTNEYAGFDTFKQAMTAQGAFVAACTIRPGSAKHEGELIRLLAQNKETPVDLYMYFVEEGGQWKLHHAEEARDVDASMK